MNEMWCGILCLVRNNWQAPKIIGKLLFICTKQQKKLAQKRHGDTVDLKFPKGLKGNSMSTKFYS